ncbi:hypothetical protein SAMN05660199_03184 [Klenkia soli]|uniref:Uncharacterized protein n=2 Tax=Klenkia soli TaxID=1052260 RepID=A0A1H0Q3Y2_9ACTN|nr:hypothetical protein SAMN05660199_03184 [Klenkia soli]
MTQMPLGEACSLWQSGQDVGSSLIRAGARVLTGVPHYVQASYIAAHEEKAKERPDALAAARTLLDAVAGADQRDAAGWARVASLPAGDFAGRGLKSEAEKDAQIESVIDSGTIRMPLWGLSLDRAVTEQYGGRFLFEVIGPFPAVPAWLASGVVPEEAELITGGDYAVVDVERAEGRTTARLRWTNALA